jgi:23S rRNA (cytosine1962-C5)-methyltransferase
MSYYGLVLSADAAAFLDRGASDLPLALVAPRDALEPGRPLRLLRPNGQAIGVALADPENECLRLLARADELVESIDAAFFAGRVERALAMRRGLGLTGDGAAYRLIHGTGDGLSGFAADVFGDWAVVHVYARAFVPFGRALADAILARAGLKGAVVKLRARGAASQGKVRQEIAGSAPPEKLVVQERGLSFEVHLATGLNAGLFTDMREHRHGLARFTAGRAVLNGFAYTGTLSVSSARAGASSVTSVDLSAGVLNWARDNFRLNGLDPGLPMYRFEAEDVARFLQRASRERARYDVILLDPPTFSAARGAAFTIERDYPALIADACRVLSPDGLLWIASNTRDVSLAAIAEDAVARARRAAQILETGGLPPDYPTVPAQPADRYLQVMLLRVE